MKSTREFRRLRETGNSRTTRPGSRHVIGQVHVIANGMQGDKNSSRSAAVPRLDGLSAKRAALFRYDLAIKCTYLAKCKLNEKLMSCRGAEADRETGGQRCCRWRKISKLVAFIWPLNASSVVPLTDSWRLSLPGCGGSSVFAQCWNPEHKKN